MVGIVVVSHSEPLARAAVELALQMAGDDPPPIEIAAGSEGGLGTDATAVAHALKRVDAASGGSGTLVVTDLGSALLSAEMGLELAESLHGEVRLSRAPFLEGLVAAVVQASIGRPLGDVEREAVGALRAKAAQLGDDEGTNGEPAGAGLADQEARDDSRRQSGADEVSVELEIVNPQGLHARPAALFAQAAADQPVEISVWNLENGQGPADAESMIELMSLGVRLGHRIRLAAHGTDAPAALEAMAQLVADGLGEGPTER